jgi:tetratricopeptide (TPR) repeat protein
MKCSCLCIFSFSLYLFFDTIPIRAVTDSAKNRAQEYVTLGRQRAREDKIDDAIILYHKALKEDPLSAEAYFYLGNSAFQQKDITHAIAYYTRAAEINPQCTEIFCNLGICANVQNNTDDAIDYFRKAVALEPSYCLAHTQLGFLLEKKGDSTAALFHLKKTHELDSTNTDVLLHIGSLLKASDSFDEALHYYRAAHALKPDDLTTIVELANILSTTNAHEEALDLYYKALQKKPDLVGALYNFGFTLKKLGHIDQAITIYKKVITLKPDYALAHFSLGLTYLSLGDFDRGWLGYEWRWAAYGEKQLEFTQPHWDGSDLHSKRIYIYAEQGLGDTFQFIRYLDLLKKNGAYVIFHTQSPLKHILQLCPYIDELVTFQDPLPTFDYHISLMSLPLVFNTRVETIPANIPYLYADETLVEEWRQKLSSDAHFKIGICWQGNANYETSYLRHTVATKSCNVEYFNILTSIPNVTFYSLQKMHGLDQLKKSPYIQTFGSAFDEEHGRFMDSAALIKNLDLVISIDTSIGHFAAALGIPTWILLPEPSDWRWMQTRTDTPWYPNVRLFRQPTGGDWDGLMHTVARALREYISTRAMTEAEKIKKCLPDSDAIILDKLNTYIATLYLSGPESIEHTHALALAYAVQFDLINHYS